jgi:hypothetical protein
MHSQGRVNFESLFFLPKKRLKVNWPLNELGLMKKRTNSGMRVQWGMLEEKRISTPLQPCTLYIYNSIKLPDCEYLF